MRKKNIVLLVLISCTFLLTGCKKQVKPEEAVMLFVNRLIYEKEDERFEKEFVDGEELTKDIEKERKDLTSELITSFNEFGGVVSKNKTKKLLKIWLDKMETETTYHVKKVKESKDGKTVVVQLEVNGIDFSLAYKEVMDQLVKNMLADKQLAQDNVKLGDMTVDLMISAMEKAEKKEKPAKVNVTVEKQKKQWKLSEKNRDQELSDLLLSFLAGVPDTIHYTQEMGKIVQETLDKAYIEVEEEYADNQVDTDDATGKQPKKENSKDGTTTETTSESKEEEWEKDARERQEKKKKEQTKETVETVETYEDQNNAKKDKK